MFMPQNLTIYLQPNWNFTLQDPGVIKICYYRTGQYPKLKHDNKASTDCIYCNQVNPISYEHYWGLLIMSFVLFGGNDDHIAFFETSDDISSLFNADSPQTPQNILASHRHKLGYLHYMRGPYLIAYDSHYQPDRSGETLDEFLETFEHPGAYDPIDYINYTCHLVGQGESIVKFKTLDFLQGVVDICTWFNLDISDYVYKLSYNGEPYKIEWNESGDCGWVIPKPPRLPLELPKIDKIPPYPANTVTEKTGKTEMTENSEKTEMTENSENTEKIENSENSEKTDKTWTV